MRLLSTSLGTWDTIESGKGGRHGRTFPLAILHATVADAGFAEPDCWEGEARPVGPWGGVLISAMDSRHFWRVPPFLREIGVPVRSADRREADPIVIVGGQAATAPAPIEPFVDVAYIGEAEAHAGDLLRTIDAGRAAGWSRTRILEACAAVPGCLVPAHFPVGHVVAQVYANDIGVTLRERLNVNLRAIHRVEIARGCQSKCGFCALGWRSRYRENDGEAIAAALRATASEGIREVHLSAGDAEAHSQIVAIREAVAGLGLRDHGWTGRLDTVRDCSVSAGKQFAFGLEGLSHRLRRAVGKARLTHDYIVREIEAYWSAGGRRLMFHLIGGLPGETDADADEFAELLAELESATGNTRQHLEIGRQPFGPLPHTPMQWFAPGLTTERVGRVVRRYVRGARLAVTDKAGQSYASALVNAVVMRGGPEVAQIVEDGHPRLPEAPVPALLAWRRWLGRYGLDGARYLAEWDVDAPTPWEHVRSAFGREELARAYHATRERLS